MSLVYGGQAFLVALAAVICLIAGVMLLLNPADEKDKRGFQVVSAILLLFLAFGLGLCSALLGQIG